MDILEKSRAKTAEKGITGMLLFKDGNFFQVIEGEREIVEALMDIILHDERHRGVIIMFKQAIQHRDFPDWSMAFPDLKNHHLRKTEGYDELLSNPLTHFGESANNSKARKLIRTFSEIMR